MSDPEPNATRKALSWLGTIGILTLLALGAFAGYLALRNLPDRPIAYEDSVQHFLYGSTEGERNLGFPYWNWRVLPKLCAPHLPQGGTSIVDHFGGA